MPLKVLSALDTARTQYYHFKAIIVAGMGLFSDAYSLFCIPTIMKLLGRIYYEDDDQNKYDIPTTVMTFMVGTALLGTAIGQLVFGTLGDRRGRRSVYGLALMLMVLSSIGCGFSICRTKKCVLVSLGIFRFLLGFGIGGDYPLSATIMSEFANKRTRGAFIAGVFSMQGFGILASSFVTLVVCKIFEATANNLTHDHTPEDADLAWRFILMLGAVPAALTYYWRMMMPETARYTALVENNVLQAAKDMEKVLDVSLSEIAEDHPLPSIPPTYPLLSRHFFSRYGRDLLACSASWFLVDIIFYSSTLFQSKIYTKHIKLEGKNVYQEAIRIAGFQAIIAVCAIIPGYWFTVYFIDRVGRRRIQIMGFLCMGLVYFAIGGPYSYWSTTDNEAFMVLYGLTFFFANFGPNTTTFIVPAELFPARFRSTCHGISGAMGKVGALLGAIGFLWTAEDNGHDEPRITEKKAVLLTLGGICLVGMMVTYFSTRETMGRSLEENEFDEDNDDNNNHWTMLECFTDRTVRRSNSSSREVTAL